MAQVFPSDSEKLPTSQSLSQKNQVLADEQGPVVSSCFCCPLASVAVLEIASEAAAAVTTSPGETPRGSYNALLEALKHNFPAEATCAMFCGGKKCKYCCAASWTTEEQAVLGLFSNWVTEDILAMSRPTTENIQKYGIIQSFKEKGIKSIFNMQKRGEHADCGNGLENNEFSYDTQQFMDSGVFVYNYGWSDYGSAETFSSILDVVNVMQFALSEGKVAVHCHAGLGRTGLLIACYFIYARGMTAGEAISFVRAKRPKAVQTTLQVNFAIQFEQFLKPYRVVFSNSSVPSFTFGQFMHRQRQILHGYEGRMLKHIPKIIHSVCERLLALAGKRAIRTLPSAGDSHGDSNAPNQGAADTDGKAAVANTCPAVVLTADAVCSALLLAYGGLKSTQSVAAEGGAIRLKCESYMKDLSLDGRGAAWTMLTAEEADPVVLAMLLWQWLGQLREPIVTTQDANLLLTEMASGADDDDDDLENEPSFNAIALLSKLKRDVAHTLQYISKMVQRLQPITESTKRSLIQQLACALTHTQEYYEPLGLQVRATFLGQTGSPCHVPRMSSAESDCLLRFFYALINAKGDESEQSQQKVFAEASTAAFF